MKQDTEASPKNSLPAGTKLNFGRDGAPLSLATATFLDGLGWHRDAVQEDGTHRDVIELPPLANSSDSEAPSGAAASESGSQSENAAKTDAPNPPAERFVPEWFAAAMKMPGVIAEEAREEKDGHLFILLSKVKSPSLDRLLRRRENLRFYTLTWIRELAGFFASVHDAGLLFRRISPEFFALDASGHLLFSRPDMLKVCKKDNSQGLSALNRFSAPESLNRPNGDALADQFGLALLIYSIVAEGIPTQTEHLPPLRTFIPDLPHGIETAIRRALSADPGRRFPSCRDFCDALLGNGLTLREEAKTYRMAASTEIGRLKSQSMPVNQDAWFIGYDANRKRGLLLLADGISTADVGSGDLASAKVFEAVRDAWEGPVGEILRTHTGTLTANWHKTVLEAILDDANTRIYSFLKQPIFVGMLDPMTHSPGSTAVLGLLDGDQLTVATVGDSCLYVLRNGILELHSVEQNLYTRLIQERRDPRDVADMDSLGALTHSIGNFFFDNDGGIQLKRLEPRLLTINLCAGDRLLLCSDGVPDCLGSNADELITRELSDGDDPQKIATSLCKLADETLGADNITALVLLAE